MIATKFLDYEKWQTLLKATKIVYIYFRITLLVPSVRPATKARRIRVPFYSYGYAF